MLHHLKSLADTAIESHPLAKGAAGGIGATAAWVSGHAHDLDPYVKAFTLWGGALVVALSLVCWYLDLRRKLKYRNTPPQKDL